MRLKLQINTADHGRHTGNMTETRMKIMTLSVGQILVFIDTKLYNCRCIVCDYIRRCVMVTWQKHFIFIY